METPWYPMGPAEARVLRKAGRRLRQSEVVPDVVRDKCVKLSRAERRALREGHGSLFLDELPSQNEAMRKGG